ncbi:hypothetical protein [Micropruina sp.]|uniref:hypothetical protein n=1 Tax=Micropruina sp. TaxID=2737536 RepID=UPI0039E39B66
MQLPTLRSCLRAGVCFAATAALIATGSAAASTQARAATAAFCADGSTPMATVAKVEAYPAGTAVTGLSVTQGTTPTGFSGSYLGYIADGLGVGKDLLLFQLSSPVIDGTAGLKPAGIWAGMSGSPVYAADGSLIGAVSYSLNYDNLPVAGVTPAEYMKKIGSTLADAPLTVGVNRQNLTPASGRKTSAQTEALGSATALRQVGLANVAVGSAQGSKLTNALLARVPKNSSPAAARLRTKAFNAVGVKKRVGDAVGRPLVAGGNVAAVYSTGDGLMGAIGTVTAICGSDVWAFGHPMDFAGKTTLAMANASAALIVPDATGIIGSYKQVTTIGSPLGMFTQDRLAGIKGSAGAVTGYPVSLTVHNAGGKVVQQRSSTVVLPDAGPDVAANLVGNAVIEDLDNLYAGTLRFSWTINYRTSDGVTGSLKKRQSYAATDVVAAYPAYDVGNDVYALLYNGFTDLEITGITMKVTLVSADALSYQPSGVQYRKGFTWVSLSGKTLKHGGTYAVRPLYRLTVNGKAGKVTVAGPARSVTLSSKAIKTGLLRYSSPSDESGCDIEEEDCDDLYVPAASSFDDLIDQLASVRPNDRVTQTFSYSRKSSTTTSRKVFTGPGVVEGSVSVKFKIS